MSETNGKPRKQDAEPNQRRRLPEWLSIRRQRQMCIRDSCIRLQMKDTVLAVRGRRLGCTSYLAGAVGVDGLVESLSFEDGGEGMAEC